MKVQHWYSYILLSAFVVCGVVHAEKCPDYSAVSSINSKPIEQSGRFRHWRNGWLSAWYKPYHMVHDTVALEGSSSEVIGKFDYDWVMHKDLEDENIAVYIAGNGINGWEFLGTYRTDYDGKIRVSTGGRVAGHYKIHMNVIGDSSFAEGYLTIVKPGTKAILFDIDGTLTTNDMEAVGDYLGGMADYYYYADEMMKAYQQKGYCIAYLTARPYWLARDTREWLSILEMPQWHLHTNSDAELFTKKDNAAYKEQYINNLKANGFDIIRAYGNADTDILAYQRAGVDKIQTYIIGELAGTENTQPIWGDYSLHYSDTVLNTEPAK